MSHTVKLYDINDEFTTATHASILDAMDRERVFRISEYEGEFTIEECCDGNFAVTLSREQMLALAAEIIELANATTRRTFT